MNIQPVQRAACCRDVRQRAHTDATWRGRTCPCAAAPVAARAEGGRRAARGQLQLHEQKLAEYEQLASTFGPEAPLPFRALNAGIGHEREWVRYWNAILDGGDGL
jgi:hypothetical protein